MARWIRLLVLVLVTCWIGVAGYARAQTGTGTLKPQTQVVKGAALTAGGQQGVVNVPQGIAPNGTLGTTETEITAAPAPFTYLMLRWRATAENGARVDLEVRASEDGQAWTEWGEVHANEDLIDPNDPRDVHWSDAIYAGLANFWQLRVTLVAGADGSVPILHEVQVHTVDARAGDVEASTPAGATPNAAVSRPAFISRASWGGSQVLNNSVAPTWYTANHGIVHHSADSNSLRSTETTWADRVRAVWSFHTYSRGWGDVGYNWLVDPNGVIYEGRNGSSDPDRDSVGFHDTGNQGSVGVVMLGTFGSGVEGVTPIVPTDAAQNAVVRVLAWKASQRGIDPLGSSFYYGCSISAYCYPYNPGSIVPNIAGHRQVTPRTTCPGDLAMGILDSIKIRVRDMLASAQVVKAELTDVQYSGSLIEAGAVIQVRFTVKNTGNVAIGTQAPQPGRSDDLAPGYVYDETECYLGDAAQSYPAFPKEAGRLRVVLGGSDGSTALGANCNGNSGGYPWRWGIGIGTTIQPGESRTVVGYVRFGNRTLAPRTITLRPNLVNEYVEYFPTAIGATQIIVAPENRAPQLSTIDEAGLPLASVYRLAAAPQSLFERTSDATSIKEGELLGSFGWDGSERQWGSGGPVGQIDQYIITQARPFFAPQAGVYTFELTTDDGAWLWIDGQLVVSNHGTHTARSVSGSKWLSAGVHVLGIKYFEYIGPASARYSWMPPGAAAFSTIPTSHAFMAPPGGVVPLGTHVALVADDLGGAGVSQIQYAVDGGAEQNQPGSILTLLLSPGDHWVVYRAMDTGGTWAPYKRVFVRVQSLRYFMPIMYR